MSSAVMAAMMASLSCVAASWCSTVEHDVMCVSRLILPTYRGLLRVPVPCIAHLYRPNRVLGVRQVSFISYYGRSFGHHLHIFTSIHLKSYISLTRLHL
jgi:hypothetical protein